jgi:BirA family biotin operon repressor/biotin-[acetyl-CoA-carboxylase] ligase
MRDKILNILLENKNKFIKGTDLAKQFKVSKMSISKNINILKNSGYTIESRKNKGYRLIQDIDIININHIRDNISDFYSKIDYFETIGSTNNYLKINSDFKEGHLVISNSQSSGRGRSTKTFYSPINNGIYMSLLLKPKESILSITKLTTLTAVAINNAIKKHYPIDSKIKWVNDILIDNKKICGILIEASLEMNTTNLEYLVVGIGINVHQQKFSEDLENIATTIENNCDKYQKREELIITILNNFEEIYHDLDNSKYMNQYISDSAVINKEVTYTINNKNYNGLVTGIDNNGYLIIDNNGETITLSSGEIKIR